jgi:hypothetical protein
MLPVDSTAESAMLQVPVTATERVDDEQIVVRKQLLRSKKEEDYEMGTPTTQPANCHRCKQMLHCW